MILASASARRQEMLRPLFADLVIDPADIDETLDPLGDPVIEVMNCAMQKGLAVAERHPGEIIISCDTIVHLDEIIGKPTDHSDAFRILNHLSGNTHRVLSGLFVYDTAHQHKLIDVEVSYVTFKPLHKDSIEQYLREASYLDKAGAYGIQEHGRMLVQEIKGDVNNVIGLPLRKLELMLEHLKNLRTALE